MSKGKGGLGKGLSALIRSSFQPEGETLEKPEAVVEAKSAGEIAHIEATKIRPNPYQPRADFDQQALDELKQSIMQKGVIQPITVRRVNDGMFELISGERRIRAITEIGLKTIPAYIIEVKSDEEMLELALIENLQREHLNPIEIAISYQRLIDDVKLTQEDVARKVSKDRTTVTNFLRLLKLPTLIQDAVRKGKISMGHARTLVSLPDESLQIRIFERIIKRDLSVRQVEKLVRDFSDKAQKKVYHLNTQTESAINSIEEKMRHALGTKVRVSVREGGRGEIVIEFYSNDDLGRLLDLFTLIQH